MLNPLSAEELARLPRPSTTGSDNRPSSWQPGPVLLHKNESAPAPPRLATADATPQVPSPAAAACTAPADKPTAPLPAWVARVEERRADDGALQLDVHLGDEAGEAVGMQDLELEGDEVAGLRLRLRSAPDSPLALSTPDADPGALTARWRRKTRVLELRLPHI